MPIYTENSTFSSPALPVTVPNEPSLTVISIDHLPNLLPRESSEAFSQALLPSLPQVKTRKESRVWQQVEHLSPDKVPTLPRRWGSRGGCNRNARGHGDGKVC